LESGGVGLHGAQGKAIAGGEILKLGVGPVAVAHNFGHRLQIERRSHGAHAFAHKAEIHFAAAVRVSESAAEQFLEGQVVFGGTGSAGFTATPWAGRGRLHRFEELQRGGGVDWEHAAHDARLEGGAAEAEIQGLHKRIGGRAGEAERMARATGGFERFFEKGTFGGALTYGGRFG
jgi:hypothetical protein